jgi:four helix bundle protein
MGEIEDIVGKKYWGMEEKGNLIMDLTLEFALELIAFCEGLEERRKFVISRQLLKAGTSIGANVREAQSPESKSDFIHKMKVAAKEANETEYWLLLCEHSPSYPGCEDLLRKVKSIQRVLSKIIGNSRNGG